MASQPEPGLCATCIHVAVVHSDRGSIFYRCKLADIDASFRKYPALPVVKCSGWVLRGDPQTGSPAPENPWPANPEKEPRV